MIRRFSIQCAALAFVVTCVCAQSRDSLPEYRPEHKLTTAIMRSWGSNDMETVMKYWEEGFRKYQPDIWFSDTLKGSATTQAALYQSVADLGLSGREAQPLELYGLYRRSHYFVTEITVASGSFDVPGKTFALAIFVHMDNPITKLTMKQLDGIFGKERPGGWQGILWRTDVARSAKENIRTWGQLGLTGEWADKPIHVYGYPIRQPGTVYFFEKAVFHGGDLWNAGLMEFDKSDEIVAALGKDRYGIAYSGISYKTPLVKPVALAATEGGPYVELTKQNVLDRTYPLTRSIYIYIDRAPEKPMDPKVKEFLRYVLSRQGQQDVARAATYLPLPEGAVREQLRKLE